MNPINPQQLHEDQVLVGSNQDAAEVEEHKIPTEQNVNAEATEEVAPREDEEVESNDASFEKEGGFGRRVLPSRQTSPSPLPVRTPSPPPVRTPSPPPVRTPSPPPARSPTTRSQGSRSGLTVLSGGENQRSSVTQAIFCGHLKIHERTHTGGAICQLSPVWVLSCIFKWPLWLNTLTHLEQANGFSPVWVNSCLFKLPL